MENHVKCSIQRQCERITFIQHHGPVRRVAGYDLIIDIQYAGRDDNPACRIQNTLGRGNIAVAACLGDCFYRNPWVKALVIITRIFQRCCICSIHTQAICLVRAAWTTIVYAEQAVPKEHPTGAICPQIIAAE